MESGRIPRGPSRRVGGRAAIIPAAVLLGLTVTTSMGGDHPWGWFFHRHAHPGPIPSLGAGEWFWMRSPEQEKVVVMSLYNRYCIRCHGVDGRGVCDIPNIPDFTDVRWQSCRTDDQIVRIVIEGRGAVMPAFRGTLALDEAWGMARYLRTFVPGTEVSRPDLGSGGTRGATTPTPAPTNTTPANPAPTSAMTRPAATPPLPEGWAPGAVTR